MITARSSLLSVALCVAGTLVAEADRHYRFHEQFAERIGADSSWKDDPDLAWDNLYSQINFHGRRGDFEKVEGFFAQIPAGKDWSDLDGPEISYLYDFFRYLAQKEEGGAEKLAAWKKAYPKSPHPWIATALLHQQIASDARGSGFAHTVSPEGWKIWREHIPRAQAAIDEALSRSPKLAFAHRVRLGLDRAGGVEPKAYAAHFQAACEVLPTEYKIYYEAFWYHLPRYYGTWKQAWKVVDDLRAKHPGHSTTARLFVEASRVFANEQARKKARSHAEVHAEMATYFKGEKFQAEFKRLLALVRAKHPTSRWPAKLELKVGKFTGVHPVDRHRLQMELGERGDLEGMVYAAKALIKMNRSDEEYTRAKGYLVRALFRSSEEAEQILTRSFLGTYALKAKNPEVVYPFLRLLGGRLNRPVKRRNHYRALAIEALRRGFGVTKDPIKAVAEHLEQAKEGNQHCAYYYGWAKLRGKGGLSADPAGAVEWLAKGAEIGLEPAITLLAEMGLGFHGATEDLEMAERWVKALEAHKIPHAARLRRALDQRKAKRKASPGSAPGAR